MSQFYTIVEEQKALMKERGYDESNLGSAEKTGWFIRQFQLNFSLALNQAHRLNETVDFDIKIVGFLGRQSDVVVFKFNYEYNPDTLELRIRKINADLDKHSKTYVLDSNEDLPASFKVYGDLKRIKNSEEQGSRQTTIKGLIEDQELLLNELGLIGPKYNSQLDLFGNCLSSELNKCLKQKGIEEKFFPIEVNIPLPTQDSFTGYFLYKFDASKMELKLEFILGKKAAASISFPIKEEESLPTIHQIEKALNSEIRRQNALLISEHNTSKNQEKGMRL